MFLEAEGEFWQDLLERSSLKPVCQREHVSVVNVSNVKLIIICLLLYLLQKMLFTIYGMLRYLLTTRTFPVLFVIIVVSQSSHKVLIVAEDKSSAT